MSHIKTIRAAVCAALAALMLLCAFGGYGCSSSQNNNNNSTAAVSIVPATTLDEAAAREAIPDGLPASEDFSGVSFNILCRDNEDVPQICHHPEEVYVESENGDIINDSVYKRNQLVNNRFNVKITPVVMAEEPMNVIPDAVKKDVLSGTGAYDLVLNHMMMMSGLVNNNVFYNWYDIPYINFNNPWWIKSATDQLTVDGKTFFALSLYGFNVYDYTYCVYFNKTLAQNYALPDMYQLVNDGKWTLDELDSLVKGIYKDLNGDGQRSADDLYGYCTNGYSATVTYQWACDNPVTKPDANGIPQLAIDNPKTPQIVDKLYSLYFENPGVYCYDSKSKMPGLAGGSLAWAQYDYTEFQNSRAVFATGMFSDAVYIYKSMTDQYGIIPYPKYDENQTGYYTYVDGHGPLMGVPIDVKNAARDGMIIEALSAEGYKNVTPAYYEQALKIKYTEDAQSVQMLDTIVAGIKYDFGYLYDSSYSLGFYLQNVLAYESKDFASYYAKNQKVVTNAFNKIVTTYQNYAIAPPSDSLT